MAFNGTLIKLGGASGTELPLEYFKYDKYKEVPDQRLDLDSTRDTTGVLHRTVLQHTATKITMPTIPMTNLQLNALMTPIRSHFIDPLARSIQLQYYDSETDSYKVGTFYMPDIEYPIRNIDIENKIINYESFTLTFIEY